VAAGQEAAERAAAFGRRESADGTFSTDGDLQVSAQSVLRAGRGGRTARRGEYRPADAPACGYGDRYAIYRDHTFEEDDGSGAGDVWGHDAGSGNIEAGERQIPSCRASGGGGCLAEIGLSRRRENHI